MYLESIPCVLRVYIGTFRPRQKVPMSRPSQTEVAYDQTFVRSPNFHAFMSTLSCLHQTFVRSTHFCAFMPRRSCVHQIFVRSCPDFRAFMFRLSCVHVQIFVHSCPDFRAFTRLSCVHVQTFVRFLVFPDYVILNARRPPPPPCVHLRSAHTCFRLGPQPVLLLVKLHVNLIF